MRDRVEKLGIEPSDVKGLRSFNRVAGGMIIGYDVWVNLKSCSGNLVVVINRACQYHQSYWRGDCPAKGQSENN